MKIQLFVIAQFRPKWMPKGDFVHAGDGGGSDLTAGQGHSIYLQQKQKRFLKLAVKQP